MEWTEAIRGSILYMEQHLLDDISADDIAKHVHISSFYLQKGFSIMTGISLTDYLRGRRMYLAAMDLATGSEKVIDVAFKYGYETPESFTKAFRRFHGSTPAQVRGHAERIKTFLPMSIVVSLKGGSEMDYVVEHVKSFKIIGFAREISSDNSYTTIPTFWKEWVEKYIEPMMKTQNAATVTEQAISEYNIGEYGICLNSNMNNNCFTYLIGGVYTGGNVPDGLKVFDIPELDWAKFSCIGPMPTALQSVNTQIFKEWLPGNPEFEVASDISIEWYSDGDGNLPNYRSEIWVPVQKK